MSRPVANGQVCDRNSVLSVANLLLQALNQSQDGWFVGVLSQNDQVFGVGVGLEVFIHLVGDRLSGSHFRCEISDYKAVP